MAQGYTQTRLKGTDGTADRTLLTDSDGRLVSVGRPLSRYRNLTGDAKALVVSGEALLKRVLGGNGVNSTMYYLQLHDATSEPSTGAVPVESIPVGIGVPTSLTENERSYGSDHQAFSTGIYVCWSSTRGTYTPVTPASQIIEVDYV